MSQRFAGLSSIWMGGRQLPVRGNVTIGSTKFEREYIAGLDYVHGFSEIPVVPFIEADVSFPPELSLDDVDGFVNGTVIAQLANGQNFSLRGSSTVGRREVNARDGMFRVKWEGVDGDWYRSG